jgi:AAA domain
VVAMDHVEEESLDRDFDRYPVPEPDSRVLYWGSRRPYIDQKDVDWADEAGEWPTFLRQFVDSLDFGQRERLYMVLSRRNRTITEFNEVMLAVLGCNLATELLGSSSQASGALNYLTSYVSKGPTDIQHSMVLFHEAVQHSMEHKSNASDADTPERRGKLIATRFLNNFFRQQEMSAPQVSACILGVKADMSTVKQVYVFVWAAVRLARLLRAGTTAGGEADPEPEPLPDELTAGQTVGIVSIPGESPVLVSQEELYRNRGPEAGCLNLQEFACLVTRSVLKTGDRAAAKSNSAGMDSDGSDSEGSDVDQLSAGASVPRRKQIGRNRNKVLRLHPDYSLYDVLGLSVNSKQLSPFMTGVPPKPPGPPPDPESGLLEPWQEVADMFAEAILTAFEPWDWEARMPRGEPTFAHLCTFMRELELGADGRGPTFVGRSRASLIYNWIHMGSPNGEHKWMLRQWRMRAATILTKKLLGLSSDAPAFSRGRGKSAAEPENGHSDAAQDAEDAAQLALQREAADSISAIRELTGPVGKDNTAHVAHLAEVAEHSRDCVDSVNRVFGELSTTPSGSAADRPIYMRERVSDVVLTTTRLATVIRAMEAPFPVMPAVSATAGAAEAVPARPTPSGGMPGYSTSDTVPPLEKPLNAGQQDFIDTMMPYMRQLREWKDRPPVSRGRRPEAPQLFLHGGPGTGKSFVLNRLVQVAQSMGVVVECMTYTNIAAKALPPGSQTVNTGLRLSRSAVTGAHNPPTVDARKSLYNKWSHVDVVVIDEASMIGPIFLGVIVEQLSIIMDSKEVAGGLCLILTGGKMQ